jgi:hypothetical protein
MNNLSVKPIQLDIHKNVCISFREDSFIVSFGDAKKFYEDDNSGAEKYIEWLKNKISQDPSTVRSYLASQFNYWSNGIGLTK